jgi:hypothetical protein
MIDPNLLDLPFRSTAQLWLTGRWGEGGIARVRDKGRQVSLALPPALFNLLAILAGEAQRPPGDRAWRAGFLSVRELGRELTRRTQGKDNLLLPGREHTIRYVYRARMLLSKAMSQLEQGPHAEEIDFLAWAKDLLEYRPFFGYRLSTAPEQLHLFILKDEEES